MAKSKLYIFSFLHQTTTRFQLVISLPQLYIFSFLHQTTTISLSGVNNIRLYIFSFLHQTTTVVILPPSLCSCISLAFYIKPQPSTTVYGCFLCCISLAFYIKPQPIYVNTLIIIHLKYKFTIRSGLFMMYDNTKISKKFQLNWSFNLFFSCFTKNCFNIRILFISNSKYTNSTRNWHN